MSSNPNEFEALRKLMALKRHEQPPSEYLDQLPDRIINRIERGEGQLSFWERISANIALRPTVAYAFGLTVCGALGLSAVYMIRQEVMQTADSLSGAVVKVPAPALAAISSQQRDETATLHVANWLGNTNPAIETQPELSLFNSSHTAIPVSYHTGN